MLSSVPYLNAFADIWNWLPFHMPELWSTSYGEWVDFSQKKCIKLTNWSSIHILSDLGPHSLDVFLPQHWPGNPAWICRVGGCRPAGCHCRLQLNLSMLLTKYKVFNCNNAHRGNGRSLILNIFEGECVMALLLSGSLSAGQKKESWPLLGLILSFRH